MKRSGSPETRPQKRSRRPIEDWRGNSIPTRIPVTARLKNASKRCHTPTRSFRTRRSASGTTRSATTAGWARPASVTSAGSPTSSQRSSGEDRPGHRAAPERGADILTTVVLTLEEAALGVEREIEVDSLAGCEVCGGSGASPGSYPTTCSDCGGTGERREVRRTVFGNMMTAVSCSRCRGSGQQILDPCKACDGSGRTHVEEVHTIKVPAGIEDGARLRVTGRGQAGARGGGSGDLYIEVAIAQHKVFRRVGDDLGTEVLVPMTVAALGGPVQVPTLEGDEEVEIEPGTQSGEVLRMKNRGMPRLGGRGKGELVVLLKVETPTGLDKEQAELMVQLANMRGETTSPRGLFSKIKEAFGASGETEA